MTIEVSIVISVLSVSAAIFFGLKSQSRADRQETKSEQASLTTVIVKLESIENTCAEIRSEMRNTQADVKENRERIIKVEASAKQAHKRLDAICGATYDREE